MKRLCLFAGYNKKGLVSDYVVYYVRKMAELAEVYYLADCEIKPEELKKLAPYTKQFWAYRHKKYDFGSWQEMIQKIGRDKLAKYDELILCNDSCFGPLYDIKPIFDRTNADKDCDFWGLSEGLPLRPEEIKNNNLNKLGLSEKDLLEKAHLQSYFLVFKNKVFTSATFKTFIDNIKAEIGWWNIVCNYEITLTPMLNKAGFKSKVLIKKYQPNLYDMYFNWKTYIKMKFPFMKTKVILDEKRYSQAETLINWNKFLQKHSKYDIKLIKNC